MSTSQSSPKVSRRDFLKISAAVGVTAAGVHLLDTYAPWLDYDQQVAAAERSYEGAATMPQQMQELVRYATLAANGHNTQPWKFAIREGVIEIHPDTSRQLPAVVQSISGAGNPCSRQRPRIGSNSSDVR